MSHYGYLSSQRISTEPFDGIIMAAMRKADDINLSKLQAGWPEIWEELKLRYHAPGGRLLTELAELEEAGQ